jgi:hypothetical protein
MEQPMVEKAMEQLTVQITDGECDGTTTDGCR